LSDVARPVESPGGLGFPDRWGGRSPGVEGRHQGALVLAPICCVSAGTATRRKAARCSS